MPRRAECRLSATASDWSQLVSDEIEVTREMLVELRREIRAAMQSLRLFDQLDTAMA